MYNDKYKLLTIAIEISWREYIVQYNDNMPV